MEEWYALHEANLLYEESRAEYEELLEEQLERKLQKRRDRIAGIKPAVDEARNPLYTPRWASHRISPDTPSATKPAKYRWVGGVPGESRARERADLVV